MARSGWTALLVVGTSFLVGCSWAFDMDGFASGGPTSDALETMSLDASSADARTSSPRDGGEPTDPPNKGEAIDASASPTACNSGACGGSSNICCARADGTGVCVNEATPCGASRARLKCASPSTCAGAQCCLFEYGEPRSGCMVYCEEIPNTRTVCETDADCGGRKCTGRRWGIKYCEGN